jgi:hypothetical protein
MDEQILNKIISVDEKFFRTTNDSQQIPITKEALDKILQLHSNAFLYKLENNEPISWVVVVPTSKDLADKFLNDEISERELLDLTKPQLVYEAIYLCSATTMPEHRRKGYVIEMMKEAIGSIPHKEDVKLFAWAYSPEGKALMEKAAREFGVKIWIKGGE